MLLETHFSARDALFKPGHVTTSDAALAFLIKHSINGVDVVTNHIYGNFGEGDEEANLKALEEEGEITSIFDLEGTKVYVTTTAKRKDTYIYLEGETPD